VLNPIRAGMVASPEQWRWSSYQATAGQANTSDWLASDWVLRQFGTSRTPCARTVCPVCPRWSAPAEHLARTPEPDLFR
jgi:hypothetical protein